METLPRIGATKTHMKIDHQMYPSDNPTIGGIVTCRMARAALADAMAFDVQAARRGELRYPRVVVSSNGSVIAAYHHDADFRALIDQADIVDADGMSLVFASRLFCKRPLKERVATTDFVNDAATVAVRQNVKFYFLGGVPGVADAAAQRLMQQNPGLQIVGTHHGYFPATDDEAICEAIVKSGADVLWVGFGSPRQEAFAIANRHRLQGLAWIRTCGGLFDHIAGRTVRAPVWLQNLGMEWLWRALQEPSRLGHRYLKTNPIALYYLITLTYDPPTLPSPRPTQIVD